MANEERDIHRLLDFGQNRRVMGLQVPDCGPLFHFAAVSADPSSRLSFASEACDRYIAALTTCVVVSIS